MRLTLVASAAILAVVSLSLAQQNQQQAQPGQQSSPDRITGNPDQDFVKDEAVSNQFEIQLSQLVQQKAQDQQVKQLAQKLIQDHQRAQEQLQQCAQAMQMQLPQQLDQAHQAMLQKMEQKQGRELEVAYTFHQVGSHAKEILMHRYQAQNAQNQQVKQYAMQTIQPLEEHERMAWQAAEVFVPQARQAGAHIRGEGNITGTDASGSSGTSGSSSGTSGTGTSDGAGGTSGTSGGASGTSGTSGGTTGTGTNR
jgi:putative membrane protein